jgi:hypothetical protein
MGCARKSPTLVVTLNHSFLFKVVSEALQTFDRLVQYRMDGTSISDSLHSKWLRAGALSAPSAYAQLCVTQMTTHMHCMLTGKVFCTYRLHNQGGDLRISPRIELKEFGVSYEAKMNVIVQLRCNVRQYITI